VEVTENLVVVTDPGFGNGAMEWVMRGFQLADGNWIVALTETDANQESSECKLWIGQPFEDDWLDLTDTALPSISRRDFFDDRADLRVLEEYELVSLQYILARNGNELAVQAKPNIAFECQGGKLALEDLPSEDATLICQAWDSFLPQPIICNFDSVKGVFVLQR
ncbi:MAG TPA: hypothetical protein VHS96_12235, partial [Bacteroidia bacterium]|nr:hypothetical protein [Bacteroidia bacterium]